MAEWEDSRIVLQREHEDALMRARMREALALLERAELNLRRSLVARDRHYDEIEEAADLIMHFLTSKDGPA